MDWLLRSHTDCTHRENFLIGIFRLTGVTLRDLGNDRGDIAFVGQSTSIYYRYIEPDSYLVYISSILDPNYLASILSSARMRKVNFLKKEMGKSLIFI